MIWNNHWRSYWALFGNLGKQIPEGKYCFSSFSLANPRIFMVLYEHHRRTIKLIEAFLLSYPQPFFNLIMSLFMEKEWQVKRNMGHIHQCSSSIYLIIQLQSTKKKSNTSRCFIKFHPCPDLAIAKNGQKCSAISDPKTLFTNWHIRRCLERSKN